MKNSSNEVIESCAKLIQSVCKAEQEGWLGDVPEYPTYVHRDKVKMEMDNVIESFEKLEKTMRRIGYFTNLINRG